VQIPSAFSEAEAKLVRELETRIRSEGWHPAELSEEAMLQLFPPFEMLEFSKADRLGLRIEYSNSRYMMRYAHGLLGPKTRAPRRLCIWLSAELAVATGIAAPLNDPRAVVESFKHWYRSVLEPSERALDRLAEGGFLLEGLSDVDIDACLLAAINSCYSVAIKPLGDEPEQAIQRLRQGLAMHIMGRKSARDISRSAWEEAKAYVPIGDRESAQFFGFLERGVTTGSQSILRIGETGILPDSLRTKSRADKLFGRKQGHDDEAVGTPEDAPEPADESAETAAEIAEQVDQVAAVRDALRRIADSAEPGSSRRIVAEGLLRDPDLSIRELARRAGRQYEGLRRAVREIQKELSRFQ
jgi:hypothetical protein